VAGVFVQACVSHIRQQVLPLHLFKRILQARPIELCKQSSYKHTEEVRRKYPSYSRDVQMLW